ncbi:MAG: hypothetical protein ACO3A4_04675 [Silvanigrellaceae bacterium]
MAAPKLSERRVSQRYTLNQESTCGHAVFEKSIVLPMLDISYGGFSVAIDKPENANICETLPRTSEVDLIMLGVGTTGRAIRVFESKQRLGYAFCHDTASVLIFLRRFIEFMRMGEHLTVLDKSLLKPPYDSSEWFCFRGDGPTDVVLHKSKVEANAIDEAVITYREKDSYRTAELRGGRLYTGISSENSATASRANQDPQANEDILRKAACVLMGYLQACDQSQQAYINHLLDHMRKQLLSSPQSKSRLT